MKRNTFLFLCVAAALSLTAFVAVPAHAQATRTWVSGVGDDVNPCSRTAPCKTFAGAISKTATAGEINCLDPGGFGAVTITKSITISCEAGTAGVLVSGPNGITINDGGAGTAVAYLRGLDFEGLNASPTGISFVSGAVLHVERCLIRGFNTAGIGITPSAGALLVEVIDTVVADNAGEGIIVKPTASGAARVILDRTRVSHNGGDGVFANANVTTGNARIAARNSEVDNNGADGFTVFSNGGVAQLQLDSVFSFNNNRGLNASGSNATLRFTRSTVTANGTGVHQDTGGSALSYGTNSVDGNGTNGTFGTVAQQ